MRKHFSRRGLAYVIAALFLLSWIGQLFAEAAVWIDDQADHGSQVADVWAAFAQGDFWEQFWQSTLENWQSEWLQVATFVIATAFLAFTGSAESSDSDERIEAKLDELLGEERVKQIEATLPEKHRRD